MGPTHELLLGENFFIRPGLMLQSWTELLQDRVPQTNGDDGEYQFNTFLRRARVFFAGGIFNKVTYLLLLEAANFGKTVTAPDGTAVKGFNTLLFQDAFFSINFNPAFTVQGGLMLVPFTRNILQSTSTYLSLDVLTTTATFIAATQTSNLRDAGLQLKGNLNEDHFEYRLGMFQGIRQGSGQEGAQGGKNSPRFAGYLQYNFFDPEIGYVFNGQYFGHKKVAGVSAGFDYQKTDGTDVDPYLAFSASAFASIPLSGDAKTGGDEVAGLVQFLHFDPGTTLAPPPAPGGVAEQNDIAAELSYFNHAAKTSVFGKFEMRKNADEVFEGADLTIIGGGLKYFIAEAALNGTLAYNRIDSPNAPEGTTNPINQIVLQIQVAYY
ncbi:MAG TPA: porin [Kofleriaceae bacterium]|nr:porin [Kofleriaceae bacterium]